MNFLNDYWPIAFMALVLFILVILIIMHLFYTRFGETNELLTKTIAGKKALLQSNEDLQTSNRTLKIALDSSVERELKLQKSLDNLIIRRDELFKCLQAAKDDEERVECIRRLTME